MDIPYLLRGVSNIPTESSVLVASSKYLSHPRLRDWVAMILLRKNGPDLPPQSEMYECVGILEELRDRDHVEAMFTAERKTNKQLDAWFNERYYAKYTIEDFADYAPDTVGGRFYRYVVDGGFEVQIYPWPEPATQLDFWNLRAGQGHDFEHILCGGGFNYLGELIPNWYRLTNVFKFINNKELAGELCVINILASLRYTVRNLLHYPQIWEATVGCIQRGMRVGQESDALFLARYESVFDLPVVEARKALGVRGVVDVDTTLEGEFFAGRIKDLAMPQAAE